MIRIAIRAIFWTISIVACAFSALIAVTGYRASESAIQECSVSAVALTVAIIPYCIARAIHGITEE